MKKGTVRRLSGAIAKGLQAALLNEVDGREFYRMAAKNARLDGTRQMFTFLMEEEEKHYAAILAQIARMTEGKPPVSLRRPAVRKEAEKFLSPLFTEDFVAKGKNVEGEMAALSIGMTLEKRAIEQFTSLKRKVGGDPPAERLFDDLIAWEREHLEILSRQHDQLREMYWEEARFWPF